MPGFIRRYGYFPGVEVITQIEGVVIVDLPPPGAVEGVSTGVTCCVGEFADMKYAVTVDGTGTVSTSCQPQEAFSGQDLIEKFGGWDETLGDFGLSDGNGYAALRNKRFSRLICAPVNLASNKGCRFFRQLPLCTSQTNTLPVVPMQGGVIAAGREFRGGTNGRLRIGTRVTFTAFDVITAGTGGVIAVAASAATQSFTVAGADFSAVVRPDGSLGIKKGDIVVIGNNNAGALQPLPAGGSMGAGTYRVAVDAASGTPTVLTLEMLDGSNFAFVAASTIPYRIHIGSDADSAPVIVLGSTTAGGYDADDVGGYSIPVRPLTNFTGGLTDGTWTAGAALTPKDAPTALTGDSADPLSGLAGRVIPTGGVPYTAAIQAPNVVASATVDALYYTAFDATISELAPVSDINLIFAARTSSNIRNKARLNVLDASSRSLGRMTMIRPGLNVQTTSAAVASADPGVGANRAERVVYNWPGVVTYIPEAVNYRLKTADGLTTIDGLLDVGSDAYMASILSNLPPELNPGQAAPPVPELMASVLGIQRGVSKLEINDYIVLRQQGVAAPKMDRVAGPIFQSGITTSLVSGQKNISRRRMADFIEDSLARRLVMFSKLPLTQANKDNAVAETQTFLEELLSVDNPAAQRIKSFSIDDRNGNTPATEAKGIFVIIVRVRLIPTGDFIVLQSEIGENVITVADLAA